MKFCSVVHVNLSINSLSFALLLFLTACDPATWIVGGTAVVGTNTACNQEGASGSMSDIGLHLKINREFFNANKDLVDRTELSIKHGNVVVIGYLKNEEECKKAIEIASKIAGPDHVFDETSVSSMPTGKDLAIDSSITSRVKTALLADGNVHSFNYDVTTVKGVVYICGTAQSRYERSIVVNCARQTSGVVKVIAYIFINRKKNTHHSE